MSRGIFVTSTGTEIGKTYVSRGLSRALVKRGYRVSSLKPIETGFNPLSSDALSLSRSCGRPDLAHSCGFYRSHIPLSPYSASILSFSPPPDIDYLSSRISFLSRGSDFLIVESAGGLLSPIDNRLTMADFARLLDLPLLVVVRDCLGVISQTLSLFESALLRDLSLFALVLVQHESIEQNLGPGSNFSILSERSFCPVFSFPFCEDNDDQLSLAAETSGLFTLFISS